MSDEAVRSEILAATPAMRLVPRPRRLATLFSTLLYGILYVVALAIIYSCTVSPSFVLGDSIRFWSKRSQQPGVEVRHPDLHHVLTDYAYQHAGGRIATEFTSPTLDMPHLGSVSKVLDRFSGYDRRRSSETKLPEAVISCPTLPVVPSGISLFYPATHTIPSIRRGEVPRTIRVWGLANNTWIAPPQSEVRPLHKFYQPAETSEYTHRTEWQVTDHAFVLLTTFEHPMRNVSGYHYQPLTDLGLVTRNIVVEVIVHGT
ncbi:uncharacterized protein SCHCODRAFT_01174891 [Schizophyllum commune H4-8]|nr:uncharacterized protein SCHCODRAFT_01174891 [Schizophyllum commune H4-8]KAI5887589.1 hypothetical protein SCHCODRAFT_01174891 [Schizophyllum commune H4-8]